MKKQFLLLALFTFSYSASIFAQTTRVGRDDLNDNSEQQVTDTIDAFLEQSTLKSNIEGSGYAWDINGSSIYYNGGKVGIGTLSPIWQLTVKDIITLNGNNNQKLHIRPNSGNAGYIYWAENGVAERGILGFKAGSEDLVYRSGATNFTNGVERLRITANRLELTGYGNQMLHIRPRSGGGGYIYWAENGVAERGILGFRAGSGDLVYRSGATNFTNGVERFRISNNGNIGIGTTSPDYKLDVVGTIRAHEIKVNLNKTADHVFASDYPLRTLSETEAFINANKHLPEIASAAEMVENGVNMAEFQIQLLQKIEELTLYTIQQQKIIDELTLYTIQQQKIIDELKGNKEDVEELKEIIKNLTNN